MQRAPWILFIGLCLVVAVAALSEAASVKVIGAFASRFQEGHPPQDTVDGNPNTRWSTDWSGEYITYQFENCAIVSSVDIAWYKGDTRQHYFTIGFSEDGQGWLNAYNGESSGTTSGMESTMIDPSVYSCWSYARIVGLENSVDSWTSISEVDFRTGDPAERRAPATGEVDILGISASSAQERNVAENVLDLNLDTRWSADGKGQWIAFDLGEGQPMFNQVSIAWYRGDIRSSTFHIETSVTGVTWSPIYMGYSSGTTNALQVHGFAATRARYVRIVGYGNSNSGWNSITEVKISHEQQ